MPEGRFSHVAVELICCFGHVKQFKTKALHKNTNTLQPLHNTVRYNTVLDITRFKDGSQKCIDYIEK